MILVVFQREGGTPNTEIRESGSWFVSRTISLPDQKGLSSPDFYQDWEHLQKESLATLVLGYGCSVRAGSTTIKNFEIDKNLPLPLKLNFTAEVMISEEKGEKGLVTQGWSRMSLPQSGWSTQGKVETLVSPDPKEENLVNFILPYLPFSDTPVLAGSLKTDGKADSLAITDWLGISSARNNLLEGEIKDPQDKNIIGNIAESLFLPFSDPLRVRLLVPMFQQPPFSEGRKPSALDHYSVFDVVYDQFSGKRSTTEIKRFSL